jgi:predicted PurR-regulated permease PerM
MATETVHVQAKSNPSQRIIAAGIVFAFLYFASTFVITLLISVLTAYFLDPAVEWLERFRVPRMVGAVIVLLVTTLLFSLLMWSVWLRVEDFATNWNTYQVPIRKVLRAVEERIESVERRIGEVQEPDQRGRLEVKLQEQSAVREFLTRGLGSIYVIALAVSFIPFLVFFMLAEKRDIWHATMQLFPPTERTRVKLALEDLSIMVRSYILGNFLVALIVGIACWIFFQILGLGNAFLVGMVSGVLNLVPYLGTVLAWIPPFVVGLAKYQTFGPFVGIAAVLTLLHLVAVNVLIPAVVGRQIHLNALAVTIALLFWGWMWGGMGLVLGIPLTAAVKVVCDHVERWKPMGRWMST